MSRMLKPNTLLQNRYLVIRQIGRGGMGAVYQATDTRLHCMVALKETLAAGPDLRRAFELEARLLARLRHPALPKVSDHFVEGDGQFLVMEYIPGEDLAALLMRNGGKFPDADVVGWVMRWADQLLDALDYLHTQSPPVVHRDIKPQNLKLTARGDIILLDFGLAKGGLAHISTVTARGDAYITGYTPNYAPLEQIQGSDPDPRGDLYSLAATLYHLLTGVRPPNALTRAAALLNEQPDPLRSVREFNSQVPTRVSRLLTEAMALNPDARPASARMLRKTMRRVKTGHLVVSAGPHLGNEAAPGLQAPLDADAVVAPADIAVACAPGAPPLPVAAPPARPASPAGALHNVISASSPVLTLAFRPDGQTLAAGGEDHSVGLWRPVDGRAVCLLDAKTDGVQSVAFSPDGRRLAAGSDGRQVRVWQLGPDGPIGDPARLTHPAACICFSPDGQALAAGGWGSTIGVWQVEGATLQRSATIQTSFVHSLAFSPDGQILAAGCYDGTVRLWQMSNGQLLRVLEVHNNFVLTVAFSPDGQTLAAGGGNTAILIWRVSDGRLLDTLQKHTNFVRSLAYSPDGQLLASGGEDKTVRLWQANSGSLLHTLQEHTGGVTSVAFSPDGQLLASGCRDNKIRIWQAV